MKVKLTEKQYSRLLTENTGDEWGRVSKTVDAFTIKVFKQIRDKIQNGGLKMNSDIVDYIVNLWSLWVYGKYLLTYLQLLN